MDNGSVLGHCASNARNMLRLARCEYGIVEIIITWIGRAGRQATALSFDFLNYVCRVKESRSRFYACILVGMESFGRFKINGIRNTINSNKLTCNWWKWIRFAIIFCEIGKVVTIFFNATATSMWLVRKASHIKYAYSYRFNKEKTLRMSECVCGLWCVDPKGRTLLRAASTESNTKNAHSHIHLWSLMCGICLQGQKQICRNSAKTCAIKMKHNTRK